LITGNDPLGNVIDVLIRSVGIVVVPVNGINLLYN
jgi:hypothetical protein